MPSNPARRFTECVDCHVPGTPGHGLSYRGLCVDCSVERLTVSITAMAEKRGPHFERWQASMVEFARRFLDEQLEAAAS